MKIKKAAFLKGELKVPGDKSISHRSIMFGAIANGQTEITNFLNGADCLSTINCFQKLGIEIERTKDRILVFGKGLHGLQSPKEILDVGNSGTTARLISGILAGQDFITRLTGDDSIQKRPMKRIIEPLSEMGARIESIPRNGCAPLEITGSSLKAVHYTSKVASAQVKSAILLAGLYADGETSITEPYLSRNHSEIMLNYFGAAVKTEKTTVSIQSNPNLSGQKVVVPGDISSAAYFLAAALILPNSELLLHQVCVNPTRDGIIRICRKMGASITLLNSSNTNGEPVADLLVRSSPLKAVEIGGALIPALIDELPVLAVLACFAEGTTVIKNAEELKVKESNRIAVMVQNLKLMGADVRETEDGMIIRGGAPLHGTVIDSHADHRIAMSFAVAALMADGETEITGGDCVNISYPEFYHDLNRLTQ